MVVVEVVVEMVVDVVGVDVEVAVDLVEGLLVLVVNGQVTKLQLLVFMSKFNPGGHLIRCATEFEQNQYELQSSLQGKAPFGMGQVKDCAKSTMDDDRKTPVNMILQNFSILNCPTND